MQNTSYAVDVANGPNLGDTELGVQIIYVPDSCGDGYSGAAELAHVADCVGPIDPTDVVVYKKKPWHCAGKPGHKKPLCPHPQVHEEFRDTVLVVTREKNESVVWWSETPFSDVTIGPSKHPNPFYREADSIAPRDPFEVPLQVCTESCNGRVLYVVRSTVPIEDAEGHMYKIEFTMGGHPIDPDMYCGAP